MKETNSTTDNQSEIIIYQADDGLTHLDVKISDETVWLPQQQMGELFQSSKANISEYIKNIFPERKLQEGAVVRKSRTT